MRDLRPCEALSTSPYAWMSIGWKMEEGRGGQSKILPGFRIPRGSNWCLMRRISSRLS